MSCVKEMFGLGEKKSGNPADYPRISWLGRIFLLPCS